MTFDKSIGMEIMEMLEAPDRCCYCDTPITPGTIGGFFGNPVQTICNDLHCLRRFADEDIPEEEWDKPLHENVFDSMRRGVEREWGPKCPDFEHDCYCCQAHELLEEMIQEWVKKHEKEH